MKTSDEFDTGTGILFSNRYNDDFYKHCFVSPLKSLNWSYGQVWQYDKCVTLELLMR